MVTGRCNAVRCIPTSKSPRRRIGTSLLLFVLRLSQRMANKIGCIGVVVDAKPGAMDFYAQHGFNALVSLEGSLLTRPEPMPMFLPLSAKPDDAEG